MRRRRHLGLTQEKRNPQPALPRRSIFATYFTDTVSILNTTSISDTLPLRRTPISLSPKNQYLLLASHVALPDLSDYPTQKNLRDVRQHKFRALQNKTPVVSGTVRSFPSDHVFVFYIFY
ncbi:hypothetical protein QC762_0091370 [Podospora pseudocomata]|uniref:Uncharacterized protein n=1 Tax=Podospora pseudocomata TaxID=2093779 RepID=A0ABR0G6F2_9PEZI|nr:hypothetical protein QC762_0091370 [Podospora pseudocomata]